MRETAVPAFEFDNAGTPDSVAVYLNGVRIGTVVREGGRDFHGYWITDYLHHARQAMTALYAVASLGMDLDPFHRDPH